MMRTFSVVIPSKTLSNVEACVRSIRNCGETCRIFIIDDFEWENHPLNHKNWLNQCPHAEPIEYVKGIKPFVFGRNVNLGIREAFGEDVIIMNDDARLLTPGGFTGMVLACAGRGICSAAITQAVGNVNQQPRRNSEGLREEKRVLAFVCTLIPFETREKIGLLDECFVGYGFDDNSYCRRVMDAGLPLYVYDGCRVEHGVLPSTFATEAGRDCRQNAKIYAEMYRGRLLPEEEQFIRNLGVKIE